MAKLQKQSVGFTQVANQVLCDKRLSAKAKGIYAYLYSKPDDWQFAAERIANDFSDGLRAIKTGLQELEKFGYLERKRQGDGSVEYFLYIEPKVENSTLDTDPKVENRTVLKPHSAKIDRINNIDIYTNTELLNNTEYNNSSLKNFSEKNSENSQTEEIETIENPEVVKIPADDDSSTKPKLGQASQKVSNARKTENENRALMLKFLKQSVGCDKFKDYNEWTEIGKILRLAEKIGKEQFLFRLNAILEDSFKAKNSNKLSYLRKEIEAFIHSPAVARNDKYSVGQA